MVKLTKEVIREIKSELRNSPICDDMEVLKEHCPNTYKWLEEVQLVEVMYKNGDDRITLIGWSEKGEVTEVVELKRIPTDRTDFIIESLEGDLSLHKDFISFYPRSMVTIEEMKNYLEVDQRVGSKHLAYQDKPPIDETPE